MGEVCNSSKPKRQIVWINVTLFILYHLMAVQGVYYLLSFQMCWKTVLWASALGLLSGQGITAGAHRLWSHRSYRAKLPLRLLLCCCQTLAFQNDIFEWARDHRVHHKFSDTDADPYNAQRGFFFSHMGWLLVKKHPDVINRGKTVDVSDLLADSMIMFQKKYYLLLAPVISFIIPTIVPVLCWNEDAYTSWCYAAMFRYVVSLHCTWLVNSAAHMWGMKPYDRHIKPVENSWVSSVTSGEGWHNYHHTFPWDYKAAELGNYTANGTTALIDFMAKIGWAYDLKTTSKDLIKKRIRRTGVSSHYLKECYTDNNNNL